MGAAISVMWLSTWPTLDDLAVPIGFDFNDPGD